MACHGMLTDADVKGDVDATRWALNLGMSATPGR
jgi:hypothetical protein